MTCTTCSSDLPAGRTKFCSEQCRRRGMRLRRRKRPIPTCRECGVDVPPTRWLCDGCRAATAYGRSLRRKPLCRCGSALPKGRRFYCGEACADDARREQNRTYRAEGTDAVRAARVRYRTRKRLSRSVEQERFSAVDIAERDKWTCGICGKRISPNGKGHRRLSIDHVLPLSKGGTDARANAQAAHLGCNLAKGNRPLPSGEQLRLVG